MASIWQHLQLPREWLHMPTIVWTQPHRCDYSTSLLDAGLVVASLIHSWIIVFSFTSIFLDENNYIARFPAGFCFIHMLTNPRLIHWFRFLSDSEPTDTVWEVTNLIPGELNSLKNFLKRTFSTTHLGRGTSGVKRYLLSSHSKPTHQNSLTRPKVKKWKQAKLETDNSNKRSKKVSCSYQFFIIITILSCNISGCLHYVKNLYVVDCHEEGFGWHVVFYKYKIDK